MLSLLNWSYLSLSDIRKDQLTLKDLKVPDQCYMYWFNSKVEYIFNNVHQLRLFAQIFWYWIDFIHIYIYIYIPKLLCLSYLFIHLTIDLIAKNWVALFQFINTFHQPSHEKSTCVMISSNEYMIWTRFLNDSIKLIP